MPDIINVCFGIQARSTSVRFPGKILQEIEPGQSMLRYVIRSVDRSAFYLNRATHRTGIKASYAVLLPHGDRAAALASRSAPVLEGPEHDVLTRYQMMADQMGADYIVRITADCPLIPPPLLSDLVNITIHNQYDYCSNVFEIVRTAIDGYDVEVMSKKALQWAHDTATDPSDREHVTLILRGSKRPEWMKMGCAMHFMDDSSRKCSVDTKEELDQLREDRKRYLEKMRLAEQIFGRSHVHRV